MHEKQELKLIGSFWGGKLRSQHLNSINTLIITETQMKSFPWKIISFFKINSIP